MECPTFCSSVGSYFDQWRLETINLCIHLRCIHAYLFHHNKPKNQEFLERGTPLIFISEELPCSEAT